VSMSHSLTSMGALHCGGHPALGGMKSLSGSLRVAEISETSRTRKGKTGGMGKYYTALEIAGEYKRTEVMSILGRFITHPAQTRHEVRVKLGVLDKLAAEVFALTVFLCDDLLQLQPAASAASRFFAITSKLPIELQMIMCHRAVGSMKQNFLHKDSELPSKPLPAPSPNS